ncbi:hypothetical protein DespoDRAFT_03343 [Desulfobacter postgatei 2ac9]|uniref:Uncharacterized protein n=1 Tax=Desulfobacter postgatei 2ac9 TaxID=879212 RepID=I5B6K4_9BACT|nr:hypothetical protein DespoDRAFT_03343 [Desulfobacter postgatei 2ac9]
MLTQFGWILLLFVLSDCQFWKSLCRDKTTTFLEIQFHALFPGAVVLVLIVGCRIHMAILIITIKQDSKMIVKGRGANLFS